MDRPKHSKPVTEPDEEDLPQVDLIGGIEQDDQAKDEIKGHGTQCLSTLAGWCEKALNARRSLSGYV